MDRDELLAHMIATSVSERSLNDWPEVLSEFADCVLAMRAKLAPEEVERLTRLGADFYRTLARSEQYRHASVWRDESP